MMMIGLPLQMLNVLLFVQVMNPWHEGTPLDMVEFYSGAGRIATTFKQGGGRVGSSDTNRHFEFEDITKPEGFCTALLLVRNHAGGFSS